MNQRNIGAALSGLSIFFNIAIQIIYVPLLLHYISKSEFGLYQLIGSTIMYLNIMDLGLTTTIVRYYSKFEALKDDIAKENILFLFSIFYLLISIVCVIIGTVFYFKIDEIYGRTLTNPEMILAKKMYLVLLANIVITILGNIFMAVITAKESFIFLRIISIMQAILKPVLVLCIFKYKPNVLYLVYIDSVLNIVSVSSYIIFCLHNKIKIKFHKFDKKLVKEIIVFAFWVFVNVICDIIYWKTGQIIIGALIGTDEVAIYAISMQLITVYMSFSIAISGVFFPSVTKNIILGKGIRYLNNLFIKIGRVQAFLLSLIVTGFTVFGEDFIMLWVGSDFLETYKITLLIMLFLFIPLTQTIGVLIMQATNRHSFRSIVYVIIAALNVLMSVPLIKVWGGMGYAIGTAGALFIGHGLIINWYYSNKLGLKIKKYWISLSKIVAPLLVYTLVCLKLHDIIVIDGFVKLIAYIVAFIIFYCLIVYKLCLNKFEVVAIRSVFGKFF